MKRQFLKGFSMVFLVIGFAFVTAVVSANGQTGNRIVTNIPFDFVVGDKVLTAGEYTVRGLDNSGNAVLISERNAKSSVIRLTNELRPRSENTRARLVFHRYGQYYFLAEIWSGDREAGRQLLRSRQERAIERELAALVSKTELAGNTYESVELLASVR